MPGLTLVLSGGGSRGAFQVGVLQELLKHVTPDVIIGTSVGALNGLYVCDHGSADGLDRLWDQLSQKYVFPFNRRFIYRFSKADAFCNNGNLKRIINSHSQARDFSDLKIPLYVNATRLSDGASVFFDHGPIMPAILASSAVVPFYPPQVILGVPYIDGGFSEFGGLSKAFELGSEKVILIDSGFVKDASFGGVFDVTRHTWELVSHSTLVRDLDRYKDHVLVIRPKSLDKVHITDFSHTDDFIAEGMLRCKEVLDKMI